MQAFCIGIKYIEYRIRGRKPMENELKVINQALKGRSELK